MKSRGVRLTILGATVLVAALAVACGGGTSAAMTATTQPSPTATSDALPTATEQPSPTATTRLSPTATTRLSPTATSEPVGEPSPGQTRSLTWEIVDVDSGTKPALALTSDDVPHVAYMLEAMPGFVKSAVRIGSSWDIATVTEGYFYGPLDVAVGPDDAVHIAFHDHQDPAQFKPNKGDAAYAVFRDGEWKVEGALDAGHDGWDNRLAVDDQGQPHMSAIDPQEFGGDGVEYYFRTPSGEWAVEWAVEAVGSGPLTYQFATSIAVDSNGGVHISYFDQDQEDLVLASRGGAGWSLSTVDSDGTSGMFSSLVIDGSGRFHIAYLQRTGISSGVVKYATKGSDGSGWEIRDVDELDSLSIGFIGARNITSLALDSDGSPWIVYSDERELKLAIWTGAEWQHDTVVESAAGDLGQLVSLKLDSNDDPHIAYFMVTSRGPLEGRVKYAKGTSG